MYRKTPDWLCTSSSSSSREDAEMIAPLRSSLFSIDFHLLLLLIRSRLNRGTAHKVYMRLIWLFWDCWIIKEIFSYMYKPAVYIYILYLYMRPQRWYMIALLSCRWQEQHNISTLKEHFQSWTTKHISSSRSRSRSRKGARPSKFGCDSFSSQTR